MSYGTSGDDYFGGQADENIIVFKGKSLYPVIDETTGATTWYERKGDGLLDAFANDIKLGTITPPSKDFVPHEGTQLGALWPDGFSDVLVGDDAKEFLSPEFQSQLRKKASAIVEKENVVEKGDNPEAAATRAEELLDTGEMTTPPDATAEDIGQAALDNVNIQAVGGTRKEFGNLRYPKDMNGSQDYIQFSMLEYKPKDLLGGGSLGTGDRPRVGFNQGGGGRNILGTCVLPIQSAITDQNLADWGEDRMNAADLIKGKIAMGMMGDKSQGKDPIGGVAESISQNTGVAKEAVMQAAVNKATGVQGILKRTKGATINPNLELLFNGPMLRPFQFQFRLSARNKPEAEEIIKIIRFFKQGMAPIRTEGNLFLLAPHTFQVHFVHAPSNGEHPYIGKKKECALKTFSTDYTPENNYTTLKDGFMTSYTITMEFQELEPIFNDDYEEDGDATLGF